MEGITIFQRSRWTAKEGTFRGLSFFAINFCLGEVAKDIKCISIDGFDNQLLQWIGFENGDWKHWSGKFNLDRGSRY